MNKNGLKIFIALILFVWSLSISVLWVQEYSENKINKFWLLVDFHSSLLDLNKTFEHLHEITKKVKVNNTLDQEILSLAMKNVLYDLERIANQIKIIEGRINSENELFSNELLIQELLFVIKKTENATRNILENKPIDRKKLNKLDDILSSTGPEWANLVNYISTEEINSQEFQKSLEQLVNSMSALLDEI